MLGFFIFTTILFFLTTVISLAAMFIVWNKAGEKILMYDEFYEETTKEVAEIVVHIEEILNSRSFLSSEPTLVNLVKSIKIAHDLLIGYLHAENKQVRKKKENKESREVVTQKKGQAA